MNFIIILDQDFEKHNISSLNIITQNIKKFFLNSKINQLRSTSFSSIFPVNNFIEFDNSPGYFYKINIKHTDQSFTTIYENTTTDFKLITIEIRHGPSEDIAKILKDTFVISNII